MKNELTKSQFPDPLNDQTLNLEGWKINKYMFILTYESIFVVSKVLSQYQ